MHQLSLPIRSATRSIHKALPFRPCLRAAATFSSSSASAQLLPRRATTNVVPKRLATAQRCQWARWPEIQRRTNSSSTSAAAAAATRGDNPSSATQSPTRSSPSSSAPALTWNRFLTLRKQRRRISLAASAVCALGGASAGMSTLSGLDLDLMQFGIDPMFVLAGAFFASAGCGWLLGPSVGNLLFNLRYKGIRADIALKEKQFYARIKKFRVDPSSSSMSNPVPDYYGEKIGSVADYRRWLKDQRAFNLKRGKML